MQYYLEYGGGLGDIFNQVFNRTDYRALLDLTPNDQALIALICHNPFAKELFEWHPKRSQLDIRPLPYWQPEDNNVNRGKYKLGGAPLHLKAPRDVEFYPSPQDHEHLTTIQSAAQGRPMIVLAASAGLPDRNVPEAALTPILAALSDSNLFVVAAGRNYSRHGRYEVALQQDSRIMNCVDKLSVPGTARLLSMADGLVTCHSALNILGWHLGVPQLLLYPASVVERHFQHGRDEWSFGLDRDITFHARFDQNTRHLVEEFIYAALVNCALPRCRNTPQSSAKLRGLYRAAQATRLVEGSIAVIGVYKGGSTRVLARSSPHKILHAFDTFCGIPNADPSLDGHRNGDFDDTSLDAVRQFLQDLPNVQIHEGIFPQTAGPILDHRFSLAFFDADTTASIRAFLDIFPKRMNAGGMMVIDDYGWERCPGIKRELDDFLRQSNWQWDLTAEYQVTMKRGAS